MPIAEDRRSTKAYVERVVRNQKKEGVDLVEGKAEEQLAGVKFSRVDFHSTLNYQAVLVKACDVYAFVFIFAASDLESTNRLIAQTVVKLDMKASARSDDWSPFSVRLNVTAKPLLPGSPAINASSIGSLIAFHKPTREDLFLRSPLSLSPICWA